MKNINLKGNNKQAILIMLEENPFKKKSSNNFFLFWFQIPFDIFSFAALDAELSLPGIRRARPALYITVKIQQIFIK